MSESRYATWHCRANRALDFRFVLHQADMLGRFSHSAEYLVVPFMPDQQDGVTFTGEADGFQVDLGDQRTSCVDGLEVALTDARESPRDAVAL